MRAWTSEELDKLGNAEELDLMSVRHDGTIRNPVTMWVVRVGGDVFVRAYKGRTSPWFRGALTRHEARIRSGGVDKDVTLEEVDRTAAVNDQVDEAYRRKYRQYAGNILNSMLTPQARAATLKLSPRE